RGRGSESTRRRFRPWDEPRPELPPAKKEIIINVGEAETRIAIREDDKLVELWFERPQEAKLAGNIYKGTVTSVFPGMQAGFVEIGEARTAFLHASDIGRLSDDEYESELDEEEGQKRNLVRRERYTKIENVVKKNQVLLVQVVKEPLGDKGARLTTNVSLPGRFVVLVPDDTHVRVSKRIQNWAERRRLRAVLEPLRPEGCGLIARTEARGATEKEFKSDIRALDKTWNGIRKAAEKKTAPSCLFHDLDITGSMMRDTFSDEVERLVVDDKKRYKEMLSYCGKVTPELKDRVELYDGEVPIFDLFNIEPEIEKMLERKVWFKRGSFLVIDQTEAMVTIDVNTGRYVGKKSQEDTILRANLQAAEEVARQIRLRDIGGLIVIDFIDMMHHSNRRRVYETFKLAFGRDRAKNSIATISDYGLIEMTRQRIRPSVMTALTDPCPICEGTGRVLSPGTLTAKIERWFMRARVASDVRKFRLVVYPSEAEHLRADREARLKRLRKLSKCDIELETDRLLAPDHYRVFSAEDGLELTDAFNPGSHR
ncbi:MAG TPA: Rne/Rng family ribonuclease, partial [Acidobacteriota bacterium]|nr:Rne/Rng family ribonuclease [Acidobacteriota bacterium]